MIAKIDKEGNIITYPELPRYWANYAGNFHEQSKDIHEKFGFYPVIVPDYNNRLQKLVNLHFNEKKRVFEYDIEDLNITLDDVKKDLRQEVKAFTQSLAAVITQIKNVYDPMNIDSSALPEGFAQLAREGASIRLEILDKIENAESIEETLNLNAFSEDLFRVLEDLRDLL